MKIMIWWITLAVLLSASGPSVSPRGSDNIKARLADHRVLRIYEVGDYGQAHALVISHPIVIFQDKEGLFWIGGSGLYSYDERRDEWADFSDPGDPGAFRFSAVLSQDGAGRIWLKGLGKGFRFFDGRSWQSADRLAPPMSLPAERSNMFSGRDGKVWSVTTGGLLTFDGKRWEGPLSPTDSIDESYAGMPMPARDQEDEARILQRAERRRELARRQQARTGNEVPKTVQPMERLLPNIFRGFEDRSGTVWLGARKAIVRVEPKTNKWTLIPPMGCIGVWLIYEDRRGRIWFADRDGHLSVFTSATDQWMSYDLAVFFPQVRPKMICSIYQDRNGQMMIGTDEGLVVFNEKDGKWRLIDQVSDDLPLLSVTAILEDNRGRIWMGTDDGLLVLEQ